MTAADSETPCVCASPTTWASRTGELPQELCLWFCPLNPRLPSATAFEEIARWQAGPQTWTQTWTLQPDQGVAKVILPPKSQHKLCGIWILFKSVSEAKFEPSEVTFLRLMPHTVFHYWIQYHNSEYWFFFYFQSWIHIMNSYFWIHICEFRAYAYEFICIWIHKFRIYTHEFVYMNLHTHEFIYSFHLWIHIDYEYMSFHTWIHMYMNSIYEFTYEFNEFIYEFIVYMNSCKLWIHTISSYMNSYWAWIHEWIMGTIVQRSL